MAILIGATHPVQNNLKGLQNYVVQFNTSFFDGLYYLKNPMPAQKTAWRSAALSYGVYIENTIPFLLMELIKEQWTFVVPLNIYKSTEADRQWLMTKDSVLNLFMINADTNVTEQIRTLKTDANFSSKVRNTCQSQLTLYKNADEVEQAILTIQKTKAYSQMKSLAYMVNVITI